MYTGNTTMSAGVIKINGSAQGSTFIVNGGSLGGSGTIGGLNVANGGTLAPGNSPGTLTVSGNATFSGGGAYNWEMNDATGVKGTNWDWTHVTGVLNVTASSGNPFSVNLISLTNSNAPGNFANFDPLANSQYTIATADGGISGFHPSEFSINTTSVTNSFSGTWSVAQSGNNLNLLYSAPLLPPTVTSAPSGVTVASGTAVDFNVSASGAAPFTYQWYRNGARIAGATSSTYSLAAAAGGDAGLYAVVVGNSVGSTGTLASLAGGVYTSFFIAPNGALSGTGLNDAGQLGNGNTTNQSSPVAIATGVTAVSAAYHTLFLKADATLWAVGRNDFGQLGDTTNTNASTPEQVASGVAAMVAGLYHTLYLKTDGTLWAMGRNDTGQLGDGSTTNRSTPVQVASGIATIAAGAAHSLFVKADGTLWAMGSNSNGQLGDGTLIDRDLPVQVASGVLAVTAGATHSLFVKTDGTLWAMGLNGNGQLGDGTITDRRNPQRIATGVVAASARGRQSFFIKTDGSLWAPGLNTNGQLGTGTTAERHTPGQVATGVAQVSAGATHTLFIKTDGTLVATGDNVDGQLGDGTVTAHPSPVQLATGLGVGAQLLVNIPVSIPTPPSDQTATAGNAATFTVGAAGTAPLTYQWAKGGVDIPGATSSAYTIASAATGDAGSYTVTVTNLLGSSTSAAATLTVNTLPVFTTHPASQTVSVGGSASFTAAATGSPTPTWQWSHDGVPIVGATSATYSIGTVLGVDAGSYAATATNAAGSVSSNAATLTVNLLAQSISFAALADRGFTAAPITLTATANSGLAVTYSVVSGNASVTGATLTLTGLGAVTVRATQVGDATFAAATAVDQTFTVASDYEYWAKQYFTLGERAVGTVTADSYTYGADHLPNLMKYALGLDPKVNATTGIPTVSIFGGNWVFTYTRPTTMPDLTYTVEISTNLTTWTSAGVTHTKASTSNGTDTWTGTYPVASAANCFFRLKVDR